MYNLPGVKQFLKNNSRLLSFLTIFLGGIILFGIIIKLTGRILGSDDYAFPAQIKPYHNVIDWVHFRYFHWSGRIFAEGFVYIFSPIPLHFWKIASVLLYAVSTGYLFLFYRLTQAPTRHEKDKLALITAIALPFLLQRNVLSDGVFWVTGSMNYFWITTFGLVAIYPPLYYAVRKLRPGWLVTIVGAISALIASSSQEQIGAALVAVSLCLVAYTLIENHNKNKKLLSSELIYMLIFAFLITAAFLISVLSPGDKVRYGLELAHWLPDFNKIPLPQHLDYDYRWLLEALVNHTGFLLAATWSLLALFLYNKQGRSRFATLTAFVLATASLFTLTKGYEATNYWFNFYASWKPQIPNSLSSLTFLPWFIAFVSTAIAPLLIFGKTAKGYLLSLLYLLFIATTAVILLSPTLYVSGWRTMYTPSILIMLIFYILLIEFLDAYWHLRYAMVSALVALATSQYLQMMYGLLH